MKSKSLALGLCICSFAAKAENIGKFNEADKRAVATLNKRYTAIAFEMITKRVGKKDFLPGSANDISLLRSERNGVVDFLFTSANGRYRGDAFCNLAELLNYVAQYSNPESVCPRINVHDRDASGVNLIGKQVGIY